jgi:hypothetical protein
MTDALASHTHSDPPTNAEDAALSEFGYTQKLDRSVGRLASFAIGFATISATTAVFTGFGAGYFTAGAPFVWTLLLAAAVFLIWVFIAADLTAKIPLAGYAYQWTSRIHGSTLAWFTGVMALASTPIRPKNGPREAASHATMYGVLPSEVPPLNSTEMD